jgi:phosphatidylserine synthase 1
MVFPNGPFIRPHPIFWRIIFGISVLYALLLQFTLYQNYDDVKAVLGWIDPVGLSHRNLTEKVNHFTIDSDSIKLIITVGICSEL